MENNRVFDQDDDYLQDIEFMDQDADYGYRVDLVLCIDGTGSMEPIIETIKESALNFYKKYAEAMFNRYKQLTENGFRIKVIVFRDFSSNSAVPLLESEWFNVQNLDELQKYSDFVNEIEAKGGGPDPENALEAIATALKTDWTKSGGNFRRQAIIVFTDNVAHDFQNPDCKKNPNYPKGMPKNIEEFISIWENGDPELAPDYVPNLGRLIVFAPMEKKVTNPDDPRREVCWCNDFSGMKRYYTVNVQTNGGCDDVDLANVLDVLVSSIK